jgi:hypothetical protein
LKTNQKKDEALKKQPHKDGEPTTKEVAGKKFQWCVHHMAWGVHSAAECCLGASCKEDVKGQDNNKPSKQQDKSLFYAVAAATIAGGPGFAAFLSEIYEDKE